MKRILLIAGTRPEVIKLAPVLRALQKRNGAKAVLCATGQHREMLDQAMSVFGLKPDIELGVMRPNQPLAGLTTRLMVAFDKALAREAADWVVVQGDTTSALCGALAAFYRRIPVAHVEAGLRTHDLSTPFPEEANRQCIGRLATRHFAPTQAARENLLAEGVSDAAITVTGNTVVDALEVIKQRWHESVPALPEPLARIAAGGRLVLVTCHRREHFGEGLSDILAALARLARAHPDYRFVFPVHPNPNVHGPVLKGLCGIANVDLVSPVSYEAALWLISKSRLIITDSGGIQEEAPSFGVPVVVLRSATERPEGIEQGFAVLAGSDPIRIVAAAERWLSETNLRATLLGRSNPYGDGMAATRIADALLAPDGA